MTVQPSEVWVLVTALLLAISCRSTKPSESGTASAAVPSVLNQPNTPETTPQRIRVGTEQCKPPVAMVKGLGALQSDCARLSVKDYSADQSESTCTCVVAPTTADDVLRIVRAAVATKTPVRVRGGAHSANHSTFPNPGELLISTARLTEVTWDSPNTVSAGGGVPVVALSRKLADYGLTLPVVNDGWSGPTVGGYISAGGMGAGSARHGGLWENVASVTMVNFKGETITLDRKHPDFLWLFGSMGQLGIIVRARLNVVSQPDKPAHVYESGVRFELAPRDLDSVGKTPVARGPDMQEKLRWFTLLVEESRLDQARADLQRLQTAYASRLRFRNIYEYHFAVPGKNPPLFFGRNGEFVGIGVWAELDGGNDKIALTDLERDFSKMVVDRDYRRYIQSEVTRGPTEFKRYFGPALYEQFRSMKRRYDPAGLLNPGAVFD